MKAVQFGPRARRDLREAASWLSSENLPAARAFVVSVRMAIERLSAYPKLGRQPNELMPEPYRLWVVRGFPYILVYNAATEPVRIVRVLHMSRDIPAELLDLEH